MLLRTLSRLLIFIALSTAALTTAADVPKPAAAAPKPTPTERIALWPGRAPNGDGTFEECTKELEVFLPPADKANGAAIVLCPGGHVAATATTHFDAGSADATDPIERLSCRPSFAWLVYPVVTMGEFTHGGSRKELLGEAPPSDLVRLYSNELQVGDDTPPVFLAHAVDDKPVPIENSRQFVDAMKAHHRPVELLELPSGGHGLNGCKGPLWEQWKAAALVWSAKEKLIPTP